MMKRYVLISVLLLVVGCSTEKVIPTDSTPTQIKTDSAVSRESCYLLVKNKTDFVLGSRIKNGAFGIRKFKNQFFISYLYNFSHEVNQEIRLHSIYQNLQY